MTEQVPGSIIPRVPAGLRTQQSRGRSYVLMGGGIDSSALVPLLQEQGLEVVGIHFDYGQPAARMERNAVRRVGRHFGIKAVEAELRPKIQGSANGFLYRNVTLVFAGAQRCQTPSILAIGIHSGTRFYDCGPRFFAATERLLTDYSEGTLRLVAPWLTLNKAAVVAMAKRLGLPFGLTYSCQSGKAEPCGSCLSCLDRAAYL